MSRRRLVIASSSGGEPPILLSWEHVLWSIENDRYKTDYSIGDLIPLDLGTEGQLNAQIADFDHDDLADGTGKAHISFITKELCSTLFTMTSDTTNIGGWRDSLLRSTTMPSIWGKLPAILQESIVEVVKKSTLGNKDTTIVSTNDKLWIPSIYEVDPTRTSSIYPDEGTTYPIFTDSSSRIKEASGSIANWWLRSANTSSGTFFWIINTAGNGSSKAGTTPTGLAVGFCI